MKIEELRKLLETTKLEVRSLNEANKVEEAEKKLEEVRSLKKKIEIAEELEKEEKRELERQEEERAAEKKVIVKTETRTQEQKDAMEMRAIIKTMTNKTLNGEERKLLEERALLANAGTNGETYVLPQTISTQIRELIRQYKSLRTVVGELNVTTLTGSFPVETFDNGAGLVLFTEDGTTSIAEATDIKFTQKSWSLKEYGAFVALSNTLLQFTDQELISYVANIFAKKAVITENAILGAALASGKTAKALTDYKGLKKSINRDLDPAALSNTVIVTNQSGYDFLDQQLDSYGRPMLQPNPTNPTQKTLFGYRIEVFSNNALPDIGSTAGSIKSPFFYGDLTDAVKLANKGQYSFATSDQAGFLKNMTYARVITYYDTVQVDASDKCYCYATIITG